MGKRIAGTCYVLVDGDQLEIKGSLAIPMTNVTREAITHTGGVAGFKETTRVPYVKVKAVVGRNFPLKKLQDGTDMTVTSELANEMVHTLSGAFLVGDPEINGEEGEVDLEFNGVKGLWKGAVS